MTKTTINNENVYSIGEIAELSDGNVKVIRMSEGTQQCLILRNQTVKRATRQK